MQFEGLFFALIMIFILPVVIISANHNAFFVVIGLVLCIHSLKSMNTIVGKNIKLNIKQNKELISELEEVINLDFKKFGKGVKIVRNLIILLFILYCFFYIQSDFLMLISVAIVLYWVRDCFQVLDDSKKITNYYINNIYSFYIKAFSFLIHLGTLVLILNVAMIKFSNDF